MREIRITRLTEKEKLWIADSVNAELSRLAGEHGCSRDSMEKAAHRLELMVEWFLAAAPDGAYYPLDGEPCAWINASRNERRQGETLAHEIAHDLLTRWVPRALFDADLVLCHESDTEKTRHDIALEVETRRRPVAI